VVIAIVVLVAAMGDWGCKRSKTPSPQAGGGGGGDSATAKAGPPAVVVELPATLEIEPADGAIARPGMTYVRWASPPGAAGKVVWRKQSDPPAAARAAEAGSDKEKVVAIGPLESGLYVYHVAETRGHVTERTPDRTLRVQEGIVFDPPVVEKQIERDFVQPVVLKLRNSAKERCGARPAR
jgi:hypothetical protein